MKRKLHAIFIAMAMFAFSGLFGQEMVVGGDMESADDWTVHQQTPDPEPAAVYEFGYTADGPTAGSEGCFHFSYTGKYAQLTITQQITLKAGYPYTITGAFKGVTADFWGELLISTVMPVEGIDWKPATNGDADLAYGFNTWGGDDFEGCGEDVDGTFQDSACLAVWPSPFIPEGDAGTDVVVYFGLKSGVYNFDTTAVSMDVMIDNLSLMGSNVAVNENITSTFTCYPVPANNVLRFTGAEIEGAQASIYNMNGQRVANHTIVNSSVPVDNLTTGLYFIEVVTDSYSEISKFVKN
jgi:hypothetical protein